MKKLSETEKAVKLAQAQAAISEFFRREYTYSDLMETAAEANSFLLYTLNEMVQQCDKHDNNFQSVVEMVTEYNLVLHLLKPFAEVEGQVYGTQRDDD